MIKDLNICYVNSAGNIDPADVMACLDGGLEYPAYLEYFPVKDPSQAVSITSVGSIAKQVSGTTLARENEVSPFSRAGSQIDSLFDCPKPEVVQVGGNFCTTGDYHGGLATFSKDGNIFSNFCGTSFSAPLFMRRLSLLEHFYGHEIQNSETLKALAYISTTRQVNQWIGLGETQYHPFCEDNYSVYFTEGTLRVPYTSRPGFRIMETDQVKLSIPKSIRSIEVLLVHSDIFKRNIESSLNSHLIVQASKTGNETGYTRPINPTERSRKSHVKCYKWQFKRKSMEGDWVFHIKPELTSEIIEDHKREMEIRYGCVVLVQSKTRPLVGSLTEEMVKINED